MADALKPPAHARHSIMTDITIDRYKKLYTRKFMTLIWSISTSKVIQTRLAHEHNRIVQVLLVHLSLPLVYRHPAASKLHSVSSRVL